MTKEFILNTLLPYKEDPSTCAINEEGACLYLTDDGKKCAVGKHLIDGEHQKYKAGVYSLFRVFDEDKILTEEAKQQHLPIKVWYIMQRYHDAIVSEVPQFEINEIIKALEKETKFEFPELMF